VFGLTERVVGLQTRRVCGKKIFVLVKVEAVTSCTPSGQNPENPEMQNNWPRVGAFGASEILPPSAQLLWCELYIMKDKKKQNNSV